jgi:hypothetical protein
MTIDAAECGLMQYVELASEGTWRAPTHLAPVVDVLERAERLEDVRAVVAAPVQHGKTGRVESAPSSPKRDSTSGPRGSESETPGHLARVPGVLPLRWGR